jgi:osmotically-inducible protein OsmY
MPVTNQTPTNEPVPATNVGPQVIEGTLSGDRASTEVDWGVVQRIRRSLAVDTTLAPFAANIRIACTEGVVTLTGTVPDQLTKMAVADKVRSVAGVKDVDNQLDIG